MAAYVGQVLRRPRGVNVNGAINFTWYVEWTTFRFFQSIVSVCRYADPLLIGGTRAILEQCFGELLGADKAEMPPFNAKGCANPIQVI